MNASGDAAEQIVRMTLQGVEVAGKMSMDGAERLVKLILASLKDTKRTKGRASLNTMLKSNKPIKVFELKENNRFTDDLFLDNTFLLLRCSKFRCIHYISEFFKCQYGECIKEGEDL